MDTQLTLEPLAPKPNGNGHRHAKPKARGLKPEPTIGGLLDTIRTEARACNALAQIGRRQARPHLAKAREYELESRRNSAPLFASFAASPTAPTKAIPARQHELAGGLLSGTSP